MCFAWRDISLFSIFIIYTVLRKKRPTFSHCLQTISTAKHIHTGNAMSGRWPSKMTQKSQAHLNITVTLKEASSTNSGMVYQLNWVYQKLWIPNLNGRATPTSTFLQVTNQIVACNCNFLLISKVCKAASLAHLLLWQLF